MSEDYSLISQQRKIKLLTSIDNFYNLEKVSRAFKSKHFTMEVTIWTRQTIINQIGMMKNFTRQITR